ncbi:dienelactone hydrolase family protein [Cryptosporangium japonicum]|uniref:dienelactone hydrolase family protein n=1 Tax=Cryptosporangium japonicum TaxID=80872 RepID=UPI003CD05EC6
MLQPDLADDLVAQEYGPAGERSHVGVAPPAARPTPDGTAAGQIEKRLTEDGVDYEVVVYRGAPHGYFADERDTWRPEPAADTWRRLEELLARNVRR